MKTKQILMIALLAIGINSFAQDEKKMSKHLKVFVDDTYDSNSPVSFERKDPHKNGWEEFSSIFENSFVSKGLNIIATKQTGVKSKYVIIIDYKYGYSISMYRMQCSDLTGQIVDVTNQNKVVGTFNYDGRFEIINVADAIATILHNKTPINVTSETEEQPEPKTKEQKLVELKQFYEKQLITKEEYEEQKKKILAE